MFSKYRLLVVLLMLAGLVLVACDGGGATATPTAPPPPPATSTPEPVEEEVIEEPVAEETPEIVDEEELVVEETPEVEEPVVEETAEVEEAAVVEETPEVDETVVAEETPEVEEPVVTEPGTVVDEAVAAGSFTTLVAAVEAAGLVEALSADGPYTVFAPTDEAFAAALEALNLAAEDLLADTETLNSILLYHVVEGQTMAADLVAMESGTLVTLNGAEIEFAVVDGAVVLNETATVIMPDVMSSNGVIHVIDAVLLPPAAEEVAEVTEEVAETEEVVVEETEVAETEEVVVEETEVAETEEVVAEETEVAETEETAVAEMPVAPSVQISRVCLVTDQGGIDDGTFNQLAADGLRRAAQDYGLETTILESEGPSDFAPNIQTCLDTDHDAVITVGFLLADATYEAARTNPNVYFIGVDQAYDDKPEVLTNLVGNQFREDQAGFLVGVMAARMTQSNVIAGVYGIDVPAVVKFRNGFEQGARYVNPDITVLGAYSDSFIDPAGGATRAQEFIGEGADVIFGAGGATGSGAIQYAAAQGVWVIGVDQDEYFTSFGRGESPGAEFLITSATKSVDVGVYDMLAALVGDENFTWMGGSVYVLEAANDGIGFAPSHDADVPAAVIEEVEQIFEMLKSGELETGVDPVTGELLAVEAEY